MNDRDGNDRAMVGRALAGDQDAYREIVVQFQRPVLSVLMRIVSDSTLAEDLAQETFVKAFRALRSYDPSRRFASWLFKIAHNTALDHLRRKRPDTLALEDTGGERDGPVAWLADDSTALPDRRSEGREQVRHLEAALAELEPSYREAVLLRFQQGLSYQEVADVQGVPMGTLKTRLHRARKQLATALASRGWEGLE